MEKIYGNSQLLATLSSMIIRERAAHTVLFYGEKGSGRKLMAQYYTKLLLCEAPVEGEPCGVCNTCKNADGIIHPDVVYAEKSGKLGGFSVETARRICSDAYIKPNNSSGRKIYIFPDCHNMDTRTQNTLLKIIEEPPDYAYFIFTSEARSDFLPTIISRCACFAVSTCTDEQSAAALKGKGFSSDEIEEAVAAFHGNIGMCIDFLIDENLRRIVNLTKSVADSIISKDEYSLNVSLYALGKERSDIRNALSLMDKLIRDTAVLCKDADAGTIGCYRDGAVRLSSMMTVYQAIRIHRFIEKAWNSVELNVNIPLVLSAFCGEVMGCLT